MRRAEKVPAGVNSESPKACSNTNWTLESDPESETVFRVSGEIEGRLRSGDLTNSSSSIKSSSDWKLSELGIDRENTSSSNKVSDFMEGAIIGER